MSEKAGKYGLLSDAAGAVESKSKSLNVEEAGHSSSAHSISEDALFSILAMSIQIVLLILYAIAVEYESPLSGASKTEDVSNYIYFQQINVMMLIGFGFLMTFLRRYAFGATTFTLMLTVLCVQWGMLCKGVIGIPFEFGNDPTEAGHTITLSIDSVAGGDIAAAAVLISFGAVLGRASPSQLLVMAFVEMVFFTLNEYIVLEKLNVTDVGGSMVVHAFGCYFGLAVSYVLGAPKNVRHNASDYRGDLFSMIGTLFLWLYWPSFNGIAPNADITNAEAFGFSQTRAFLNTILALCSCTMSTLSMSFYVEGGKLDMVHVQNATLAGGVAVGSAANLYLTPAGAMGIGILAALMSVGGYKYLSPILEQKFGVHDTCGVHNLHGTPAILSAFVSAVAIALATKETYPSPSDSFKVDSFDEQANFQVLGVVVTLLIAAVSGALTGVLITKLPLQQTQMPFQDAEWFGIPEPHEFPNKKNE